MGHYQRPNIAILEVFYFHFHFAIKFFEGFDGTSNVLAGKLYGIPIVGTQAHSFITSFTSANELKNPILPRKDNPDESLNLLDLARQKRDFLLKNVSFTALLLHNFICI